MTTEEPPNVGPKTLVVNGFKSHLNVLNPSHIHPGLGLVRFQFHSQLVALVAKTKTHRNHYQIWANSNIIITLP